MAPRSAQLFRVLATPAGIFFSRSGWLFPFWLVCRPRSKADRRNDQ